MNWLLTRNDLVKTTIQEPGKEPETIRGVVVSAGPKTFTVKWEDESTSRHKQYTHSLEYVDNGDWWPA